MGDTKARMPAAFDPSMYTNDDDDNDNDGGETEVYVPQRKPAAAFDMFADDYGRRRARHSARTATFVAAAAPASPLGTAVLWMAVLTLGATVVVQVLGSGTTYNTVVQAVDRKIGDAETDLGQKCCLHRHGTVNDTLAAVYESECVVKGRSPNCWYMSCTLAAYDYCDSILIIASEPRAIAIARGIFEEFAFCKYGECKEQARLMAYGAIAAVIPFLWTAGAGVVGAWLYNTVALPR